MKESITQSEILKLLDRLYEQSVQGVQKISPPVRVLAQEYIEKNDDIKQQRSHLSITKL